MEHLIQDLHGVDAAACTQQP